MIKRLIDESSESDLAELRSLVNSVNNHIIKKILNLDAIDYMF
jgi:hypothetical protein